MNLFYQPLIPEGILYLDPEESRHCMKVLRKKPGDRIRITDGKGAFYEAIILKTDDRQCSFEIEHKTEEPARRHSVHIAISPTKNPDRIEWFVEKAVEFGVEKISLMECEHT
jgi:16S rRNA (uracil1498-N3)-methyltransferase